MITRFFVYYVVLRFENVTLTLLIPTKTSFIYVVVAQNQTDWKDGFGSRSDGSLKSFYIIEFLLVSLGIVGPDWVWNKSVESSLYLCWMSVGVGWFPWYYSSSVPKVYLYMNIFEIIINRGFNNWMILKSVCQISEPLYSTETD